MHVKIFKYWNNLDILRQTPGSKGQWRGHSFEVDKAGTADYVVIHCHAGLPAPVICPKGNVWLMMGEPPNEITRSWHIAPEWIDRVYTSDEGLSCTDASKYQLSIPGIPWHVDRDYDFLVACPIPEKSKTLSWVTSNMAMTEGHRQRIKVIQRLRMLSELDLFGRGLCPIADKWDALAPYRYSIAYENFNNTRYWTEKIMDCFLAWTMPIYYGCTELERFFPPESFVRIDPTSTSLKQDIKSIVQSDLREKNIDAIAEARRRVLHDYNFFEMIVKEIEAQQSTQIEPKRKELVIIRDHTKTPLRALTDALNKKIAPTRIKVGAVRRRFIQAKQ